MGDNPQSDDLHVHISKNRFEEIPITYPFRTDNFSILFVVSGSLKIQLNLINHTIQNGEIIPIKPNAVVHLLKMTNDLEIIAIGFSTGFIIKNSFTKMEFGAIDFFTRENIPKLKLDLKEKETSVFLSNLLERYNGQQNDENNFKSELIKYTFGLLAIHYSSIFKKNHPNLELSLTRNEELVLRFFKNLNLNFKGERSVKFYADNLSITSGHLSKVLKEVSGKTASQIIDDTVILEAKLLLGDPSLSVAEVAQELKFSDQSFFGKYFKKHSGYAPTQYRNIKLTQTNN